MAGSRFTKKLQAIKSKMMMDDVPVDPSRRKLFTLPPEETSQSLPATKQTSKESPLTQLANKPVDRREFLKQAGQSAKSAAVRGILPELGKLVEAPIEKALPTPTDYGLIHNKLKDIVRSEIENLEIPAGHTQWYSLFRDFIDENRIKPKELKRLDRLADDAFEGDPDATDALTDALPKLVDAVDPDTLPSILLNLPNYEESDLIDLVKALNKDNDVPRELLKDFIDYSDPRSIDFSEEELDEIFNEAYAKKSE